MTKCIKQYMIGSCGAQIFCQSKDAGPRWVTDHSQFSIARMQTHVISTSILTKRRDVHAHNPSYDWMDTLLLVTNLTKSDCVHCVTWHACFYPVIKTDEGLQGPRNKEWSVDPQTVHANQFLPISEGLQQKGHQGPWMGGWLPSTRDR